MDISNFINWFINQVINIFSWVFNLLDSITFNGTSLLKVIVTIIIIGVLIPVILTISQNVTIVSQKSERINDKRERTQAKNASKGKSRWI